MEGLSGLHYSHCYYGGRGWFKSKQPSMSSLIRGGGLSCGSRSRSRSHHPIRCVKGGDSDDGEAPPLGGVDEWWMFLRTSLSQEDNSSQIISATLVGVLTGVSVVVFNNLVHEIRDFSWDGIPNEGASWVREKGLLESWPRIMLVPLSGGILVSILNYLRDTSPNSHPVVQQLLKTVAACVTLGTGNSLGPEGPSVEIGRSIGKGVSATLFPGDARKLPLIAAASAAAIASGFNAAVAGCFFAVESVLWPSPDSSLSLTNTTSMVILSAVIASVLSQLGLGAEPAFKVPLYDFRSPTELPLYLLLGILCGFVSLAFTSSTTLMIHAVQHIQRAGRIPKPVFPVAGAFTVALIALAYPEILYWGFQNVDLLLESPPFVKGLSAELLLQLVCVKIIATSVSRASGLVGGYYAPSLFIGAATGMAYGKLIAFALSHSYPLLHISFLEVASPQAYGLVGMAATLAGVCQVPLTSVLLLFELTQDYRIVLPLLGAVGMSSWITSSQVKRRDVGDANKLDVISPINQQNEPSNTNDICEIESSRCFDDSDVESEEHERGISISQAMRTSFATVFGSTLLVEAVSRMLAEKQSCALIVNDDGFLIGILSIEDVIEFSKSAQARKMKSKEPLVADVCSVKSEKCEAVRTVTPGMDLVAAQTIMVRHGLSSLAVVSEHEHGSSTGKPVGVIDMQCIKLARRAAAAKQYLQKE